MVKKVVSSILALVLCLSISIPALAADSENTVSTRGISKTITLDFEESTSWGQTFDNIGLIFHHNTVSVSYDSNTPNTPNAYVWVELHADMDHDGVYELCGTGTQYRLSLKAGESLVIGLPDGTVRWPYKLVFTNRTASVQDATFTIDSYYN